ncbi:MAG: phosphoenolpyruvate carboxykinase (ATP) [Dehalococcoidales bacterium]|nr:phosphoenolpyruvate carboxykinase (ATP) [Dehalococcoidales bacterium]
MEKNSSIDSIGLEKCGIKNLREIYHNLTVPALYEHIIRREEGRIASHGPIVVSTGHHTGRSPDDKYIVSEESSRKKIWWSSNNKPFEVDKFEILFNRLLAYLQGKDIYIQDCYAGADTRYRIPIRIISEFAWHSLFSRNMFIQSKENDNAGFPEPEFTILSLPGFHATPDIDSTSSETFIIVNFGKRLIIIGGTSYAGEIKKAVFTVLTYLLPQDRVLPMHCAANIGPENDIALYFGLSGTGKTTLSTDVNRKLIGDDEHGWSVDGIFNFEGGCYAKVIGISAAEEPQIYDCTRRFSTILENVVIDSNTRQIDLNDNSLTENTRASYPVSHITSSTSGCVDVHPQNIFMLSYDAFGILPPVTLLTPEQAVYYFLQGYTATVAGTEVGRGNEPKAVFSPCFGAPFMALPPANYARVLLNNIIKHKVTCWMVNTGLVGGGFGTGKRISLPHTRELIRAALSGELSEAPKNKDPIFGFNIPAVCGQVPEKMMKPAEVWKDKRAYTREAKKLAAKFIENFKQFESDVPKSVAESGPVLDTK